MQSTDKSLPVSNVEEDLSVLLKPGLAIRLEGNQSTSSYVLVDYKADGTIVCRAIGEPIGGGYEVGSLLAITRIIGRGEYNIPVKVTSISSKAKVITLQHVEEVIFIERRNYERVRAGSNVRIRLQFDGSRSSMYKSLRVQDIGGGGVSITIHSRNPVSRGQYVNLIIEFLSSQNRVSARGKIVHCTYQKNNESNEYILGIQFTGISAEDRAKVISYVENELKKQKAQQEPQEHLETAIFHEI